MSIKQNNPSGFENRQSYEKIEILTNSSDYPALIGVRVNQQYKLTKTLFKENILNIV